MTLENAWTLIISLQWLSKGPQDFQSISTYEYPVRLGDCVKLPGACEKDRDQVCSGSACKCSTRYMMNLIIDIIILPCWKSIYSANDYFKQLAGVFKVHQVFPPQICLKVKSRDAHIRFSGATPRLPCHFLAVWPQQVTWLHWDWFWTICEIRTMPSQVGVKVTWAGTCRAFALPLPPVSHYLLLSFFFLIFIYLFWLRQVLVAACGLLSCGMWTS